MSSLSQVETMYGTREKLDTSSRNVWLVFILPVCPALPTLFLKFFLWCLAIQSHVPVWHTHSYADLCSLWNSYHLTMPSVPANWGRSSMKIRQMFRQNFGTEEDSIHQVNRAAQVTIFRLRTGHCQLLSHLHRLKISHSDQCPSSTGPQISQPHPAVLPHPWRFETPDMTQSGGCPQEALGPVETLG